MTSSAIKKNRLEILQQRLFSDLFSSDDFQNHIKRLRDKYSIDLKEQFLGNPKASKLMSCDPEEFEYLKDPKVIKLNEDFYADAKKLCDYFNLPDQHVATIRRYLLTGRLNFTPKNVVSFTMGGIEVSADFDIAKEDWNRIWEEIQKFKKHSLNSNFSFNFGVRPKLTSKKSNSIDTILWFWRKQKNPKIEIPSAFESIINSAGNSVKQKWRIKIKEWEGALGSL